MNGVTLTIGTCPGSPFQSDCPKNIFTQSLPHTKEIFGAKADSKKTRHIFVATRKAQMACRKGKHFEMKKSITSPQSKTLHIRSRLQVSSKRKGTFLAVSPDELVQDLRNRMPFVYLVAKYRLPSRTAKVYLFSLCFIFSNLF